MVWYIPRVNGNGNQKLQRREIFITRIWTERVLSSSSFNLFQSEWMKTGRNEMSSSDETVCFSAGIFHLLSLVEIREETNDKEISKNS